MLQRFVAGSAMASIAIAFGALALILMPTLPLPRTYPLTIVWCFVPLAWGVWAVMAPARWVPARLPLWGAILGLVAGSLAAFTLNLPSRILGQTVSIPVRGYCSSTQNITKRFAVKRPI
jgi:hypothetical protein